MCTKKLNTKTKKTEEVQDIIDRMPRKTPRLVAVIVISLASLLLLFGWIIKYPESVSGVATVSAVQSPVRFVAQNSGRLHLLVNANRKIKQGSLMAYLESNVNIAHLQKLDSLLALSLDELKTAHAIIQNAKLGEITIAYLDFENSINTYRNYLHNNIFVPRIEQLEVQIKNNRNLLGYLQKQLPVNIEKKEISLTNLMKDSIQYYNLKSINETDFLRTKTSFLNAVQNLNSLKKDIEQAKGQEKELVSGISQLQAEQIEYEQKMSLKLHSSFEELKNQVNQWKLKYAFIAPFDGKVEFLSFWKENIFIKAGEEVFAVMPLKNPVMAQVLIPSIGAGKVKSGQEVILKLDDFPYLEYGAITGKVKSVSMLTSLSEGMAPQEKVNTY